MILWELNCFSNYPCNKMTAVNSKDFRVKDEREGDLRRLPSLHLLKIHFTKSTPLENETKL